MLLVCCRSSSLSYPNGIPLAKPFPMGISVSLRISWLKVECLSVAWVALLRRSFIYYTYNHKLLFTVLKHIRHTYTPASTDIYFFFGCRLRCMCAGEYFVFFFCSLYFVLYCNTSLAEISCMTSLQNTHTHDSMGCNPVYSPCGSYMVVTYAANRAGRPRICRPVPPL